MNKSAWWAWAVKNSICVICWAALAVYFNKWWIALFGVLFLNDLKLGRGKHYRVCDECGRHSPYADNYNEGLDKAKEAGWVRWKKNGVLGDYCPECQSKLMNINSN